MSKWIIVVSEDLWLSNNSHVKQLVDLKGMKTDDGRLKHELILSLGGHCEFEWIIDPLCSSTLWNAEGGSHLAP